MAAIKKQFDITGMHCGSCAAGIQMFLSSTDGVKDVTVDYDAKRADVLYDDEQTSEELIIKGVQELGYDAKPA